MMSALALVLRDPTLRLVALLMALIGISNASLFPYQSLVALHRIGLGEGQFALVLLLASVLAVSASVAGGILSDQRARRRPIAILTAVAAVAGPGLMLLLPGRISLVLCHGVMMPLSVGLYAQGFALTRLACQDRPAARDGVLSLLRALLSLTFLVALGLWSCVFAAGVDVMAVYAVGLLAGAALLALVLLRWPRDGATRWSDPPSGLNLRQSLAEIGRGRVLARIAVLGAITSAPALYMVLVSVVFTQSAHRSAGDVALFVGLVAGAEVPFMLALPRLLRHAPRPPLIAAGGLIYALYLGLLPVLAPGPAVWLLPVLAGLGGAAILTLPIAYLQDLMAVRPGAGSSLIAIQKVVADMLCALAFAAGTAWSGLAAAALIGAGIAVAGVGLFLAAAMRDRRSAPGLATDSPTDRRTADGALALGD